MKYYSQRDPKWANLKLGNSNSTIGRYGCFLTSLAMLAEIPPDQANEKLKKEGAFSKDLIISDKAADALGLEYSPPARSAHFVPYYDCIAEVDFNPATAKKEQHFVVYLTDGKIVDPWDLNPKPKKNPYNIISIRLFKKNKMKKELISILEEITKEELGENLNENEQERVAKKLEEIFKDLKSTIKTNDELIKNLKKTLAEKDDMIRDLLSRIDELSKVNRDKEEDKKEKTLVDFLKLIIKKKMIKERIITLVSRKFILAVFILVASFVLVVTNDIDFEKFIEIAKWIFGFYAGANSLQKIVK